MSDDTPDIDMRQLGESLREEPFVTQLRYLHEVGSTNDELRKLADAGAAAGTVLLAGSQSAGRGRLGRRWHSPRGNGLYLSILLRPAAPVQEWTRWTLAASVAAAEAARECSGATVIIKWPNDLMLDGRKLGGLLTEMRSPANGGGDLIIGLGLNVAAGTQGFPRSLSDTAISLEEVDREARSRRESLATVFLREMGQVDRKLERGDWSCIEQRWLKLAPQAVGCRVRVAASEPLLSYHGTTSGLDSTGALLVIRDDDGRRETVRDACSVSPLERD